MKNLRGSEMVAPVKLTGYACLLAMDLELAEYPEEMLSLLISEKVTIWLLMGAFDS